MHSWLSYITAIIAILSFVFSVLKYIDLKNREEKRLIYENYSKILKELSGRIQENGNITIEVSYLIGNIYRLIEFRQYKAISIPILEYMKKVPIRTDEQALNYINKAIDYVLEKLK